MSSDCLPEAAAAAAVDPAAARRRRQKHRRNPSSPFADPTAARTVPGANCRGRDARGIRCGSATGDPATERRSDAGRSGDWPSGPPADRTRPTRAPDRERNRPTRAKRSFQSAAKTADSRKSRYNSKDKTPQRGNITKERERNTWQQSDECRPFFLFFFFSCQSVIKGRAIAGASRPTANPFRALRSGTTSPTANVRVSCVVSSFFL